MNKLSIKRFCFFVMMVTMVLPISLFSQEVGSKAPDIFIERWVNKAPSGNNPFSGRNVVLEFWATWCGPCKKAISHINKLVDKYQDDRFIFVSITKENAEKVKDFMKTIKMKAYVAIDDEGKTNKHYNINGIPQCFIVNPEGIIVWSGHPNDLTEEMVKKYKQDGVINVVKKAEKPQPPKPMYALDIYKSSSDDKGFYSIGDGEIMFDNLTLSSIFEILLKTNSSRFKFEGKVSADKYSVYYRSIVSNMFEEYRFPLFDDICHAMRIKAEIKSAPTECYVLSCKDNSILNNINKKYSVPNQEIKSEVNTETQMWTAKAVQLDLLTRFLETNYKIIIENQSGLNGYYDFEIDKSKLENTVTDLEKIGLKLTKTNLPIDFYHFECK